MFSIPQLQACAALVFSISSQLRGSDLRCTPSVSMPLDSSLLIEGAKPTAPPPEVQVVQVVVAAEGDLVTEQTGPRCFLSNLYIFQPKTHKTRHQSRFLL